MRNFKDIIIEKLKVTKNSSKFTWGEFVNALNNCEEEVTIDSDGCGNFGVKSRSVSVWIKK